MQSVCLRSALRPSCRVAKAGLRGAASVGLGHRAPAPAAAAASLPLHGLLPNHQGFGQRRWNTSGKGEEANDMVDPSEEGKKAPAVEESPERAVGEGVEMNIETMTERMLEIVSSTLYKDKEIFIRELVSNASDALEKLRFLQTSGADLDSDLPAPQINISVDGKASFTIQDSGLGMTKEEVVSNLGTIAKSGTKAFVEAASSGSDLDSLIGQFGVGFYSAFTVASKVRVFTRSANKDSTGYMWESDGKGRFTITEAENVEVGTKIVITLKEGEAKYATKGIVEGIIHKHSEFIEHPIFLNGVKLNTNQPLWREMPSSVKPEQHNKFYQRFSKNHTDPRFTLHTRMEVPLEITALFYVPQSGNEMMGTKRMEQNISLYCRNVLIQERAKGILPDWLRFLHGVVESPDLPLNVSREELQDSALVQRLNTVLTRKVLKWLKDQDKKDPEAYAQFFKEFGNFLKEGVCSSFGQKNEIAPLLRYQTNKTEDGGTINLDTYSAQMKEGQEFIYYLCSSSMEVARSSPYLEQFQSKGVEVLILPDPMDEIVVNTMNDYKQKLFRSIEGQDLKLETIKGADGEETPQDDLAQGLGEREGKEFAHWLVNTGLPSQVKEAKVSSSLTKTPMLLVGHESASIRRLQMLMAASSSGKAPELPPLGKQTVEFNPRHPLIKKLAEAAKNPDQKKVAELAASQLYDNALISARLLDNPLEMVPRMEKLLEMAFATQSSPEIEGKAEEKKEE